LSPPCPSSPSSSLSFFLLPPPTPISTLFPYTTLFRSSAVSCRRWPASPSSAACAAGARPRNRRPAGRHARWRPGPPVPSSPASRSEEHTSELQSLTNLLCPLLLQTKKHTTQTCSTTRL